MSPSELEPGAWLGKPVSILGGGPSLKGFDFSRIPKHHKIIAVNAAFLHAPQADICFTEDVRFIERFGAVLEEWDGLAVWHCLLGIKAERGLKACPSVQIIQEKRDDKFWAKDLSALSFSSNSVVGAINLAEILGASVIYLLGVDCRTEGPMVKHFHEDYNQAWDVGAMQVLNWKSDFENWVYPNCKVPIVNVINPDYESAVQCWMKVKLEDYVKCA